MNSIERADMSVIGTWRDDIKVDQEEFQKYVELKGRKYVIDKTGNLKEILKKKVSNKQQKKSKKIHQAFLQLLILL